MTNIIAIDGHGGSGKSTLADLLAQKINATIVHTDDYATYENPLNWWPEAIEKVLKPAKDDKENIGYLILEGVSSLRKEFRPYIDFGIFIDTPIDVCRERMQNREKDDDHISNKLEEWLADEIDYMKRDNPKEFASFLIDGSDDLGKQLTEIVSNLL